MASNQHEGRQDPQARARFITNCTGPAGAYPAFVEVAVLQDNTLELTIQPGSVVKLTPEQAAGLRSQLAHGIAEALQGVRWEQ